MSSGWFKAAGMQGTFLPRVPQVGHLDSRNSSFLPDRFRVSGAGVFKRINEKASFLSMQGWDFFFNSFLQILKATEMLS